MRRPDSTKPERSDLATPNTAPAGRGLEASEPSGIEGLDAGTGESDFAGLAAKFAVHGGGKITAELSGDLALDILLNEIVEQACLATGASGAAIALRRGEEMVCRASSGGNAPELGSRLDMDSGLSGACMRSRSIQCCDDALSDPRADAEISRQLGVRSVVVYPLLRDEELIGILEVFSARPCAFGDRDLQTLEVLARRILKNAQARQASLISIGLAPLVVPAVSTAQFDAAEVRADERGEHARTDAASDFIADKVADYSATESLGETVALATSQRRFDWFTILTGAIIVIVALLMAAVVSVRMGWLKVGNHQIGDHQVGDHQVGDRRHASSSAMLPASSPEPGTAGQSTGGVQPTARGGNNSTSGQTQTQREDAAIPEGGLRVYANGKEIFRMPPTIVEATAGTSAGKNANSDSSKAPAGIAKLLPAAAEDGLVRRVEPEYPEQARLQRIQGPVLLDVRITRQGVVQNIKLISGDPVLAEAATAAVQQWRFKPYMVGGRAVDVETEITLKFTLPPE
jgi:TonB family protein